MITSLESRFCGDSGKRVLGVFASQQRRTDMAEIHLGGLVLIFEDDTALMEWLDAHADEVREED